MPVCLPADLNNHHVCLEIVKTTQQQKQGLVGRKSIKNDYGMLFDMRSLGTQKRAFWAMQGMKFPIDIIWISNNKIITINYNVQPCKSNDISKCQLFGGFPVDYVIETKAGNANNWGLYISQNINFSTPTK